MGGVGYGVPFCFFEIFWRGLSWPRTQSFFLCTKFCLNCADGSKKKKREREKEKENVCVLFDGQNFVV